MAITLDQIKELREATGISIGKCKEALEEANGDMDAARAILTKNSAASAAKKADRTLNAGTVGIYSHGNGMIGSMVELFCETDFVSNNAEFKTLAREIAMQISATSPEMVKSDNPEDFDKCLIKQSYIKNPDKTIEILLQEAVQKFGEKVEIGRMARFAI